MRALRSIDIPPDPESLKRLVNKPHYSLDAEYESPNKTRASPFYSNYYSPPSTVPVTAIECISVVSATQRNNEMLMTDYTLLDQQKRDVLHKAENQFRSLMISSSSGNNNNFPKSNNDGQSVAHQQQLYQQQQQQQQPAQHQDYQNYKFAKMDLNRQAEEIVDSRSSRVYDLERAAKQYFDDPKRYVH